MATDIQSVTEPVPSELPARAAPQIEAHLAGVALTSPDPRRLVEFYARVMGYAGAWSGEAWMGTSEGRTLAVREGSGNALDHAAFALSDAPALDALVDRLDGASISYMRVQAGGFAGDAVRFEDPDGNRLVFGLADGFATDTTPGAPARLQHVVFATDQAPTMVRFYCDVVGFAPSDYVKDEAGDLTSAFLNCSAEHHSLAIFRAPRRGLDHLCYDVADWSHIRNWADRFAEHRVTLRWGPGRHGPGNNLFFFVNDPDGNWLEFSAELERIDSGRPIKLWAHEERTLNSWGTALMRS